MQSLTEACALINGDAETQILNIICNKTSKITIFSLIMKTLMKQNVKTNHRATYHITVH